MESSPWIHLIFCHLSPKYLSRSAQASLPLLRCFPASRDQLTLSSLQGTSCIAQKSSSERGSWDWNPAWVQLQGTLHQKGCHFLSFCGNVFILENFGTQPSRDNSIGNPSIPIWVPFSHSYKGTLFLCVPVRNGWHTQRSNKDETIYKGVNRVKGNQPGWRRTLGPDSRRGQRNWSCYQKAQEPKPQDRARWHCTCQTKALRGGSPGNDPLTSPVPPADLQLLLPIGWTQLDARGKGYPGKPAVEVPFSAQTRAEGCSESPGESEASPSVAWKLKPFPSLVGPLFTYSRTIYCCLQFSPFLQVIFQISETKASIHQPPKEEIEKHRETFIFRPFFRYWNLMHDVFVYERVYPF